MLTPDTLERIAQTYKELAAEAGITITSTIQPEAEEQLIANVVDCTRKELTDNAYVEYIVDSMAVFIRQAVYKYCPDADFDVELVDNPFSFEIAFN